MAAARRRKTTRRRTGTSRSSAPATPVEAGPGQQLWLLDVPFDERQAASSAGVRWDAARRCSVYVGVDLPDELSVWSPAAFSWAAWQAATETGVWPDQPGDGSFTLRAHQRDAVEQMGAAHALGRPAWVLADELGLGKTLSAIAGIHALPADQRDVLVVCPVSVIPAWREHLYRYGTGGRRWCVVSTDSVKGLLSVPASALQAKTAKTRNKRIVEQGTPTVAWDVVVLDESHRFKGIQTQRAKAQRKLTAEAFTIAMSATLGSTPLELTYLAPVLGHVTGTPVGDLAQFETWAKQRGFGIERGEFGTWTWDENPADLDRLRALLFDPPTDGTVAVGLRRRPDDLAGWPNQDRVPRPVELEPDAQRLYAGAWTAFRRELQLAKAGKDPTGGFAAALRFRQKASLLRVDASVQTIVDLIADGYRPAVSVQFLETLDATATALQARGVSVATMHGHQTPDERETERRRFQTGEAQAIVHTLVEGINLHATEPGADHLPRVTVIADARPSVIQARQIEGRTQRDGCRAPAIYLYAPATIEHRIITRLVERLTAMATLHGDHTVLDDLDDLLMELAG
jgi:superfamily II DNA or RNA helicase